MNKSRLKKGNKIVSFVCEPDTLERLERYCQKNDIEKSKIIRKSLQMYLDRYLGV